MKTIPQNKLLLVEDPEKNLCVPKPGEIIWGIKRLCCPWKQGNTDPEFRE